VHDALPLESNGTVQPVTPLFTVMFIVPVGLAVLALPLTETLTTAGRFWPTAPIFMTLVDGVQAESNSNMAPRPIHNTRRGLIP
jgi:hypothetical protein